MVKPVAPGVSTSTKIHRAAAVGLYATWNLLSFVELSVQASVRPAPLAPAALRLLGADGMLVGVTVCVAVSVAVGVGLGLGEGDGLGDGLGLGLGDGVADGVGLGLGEAVGDGVAVPPRAAVVAVVELDQAEQPVLLHARTTT